MGSQSITCVEGCTFDAPTDLADQAMALHRRTLHDYPEKQPCQHDWVGFSYGDVPPDELTCRLCGKRKMVFPLYGGR